MGGIGKFSGDAGDILGGIVLTNKTKTLSQLVSLTKKDSYLKQEIKEMKITDSELKDYIIDTVSLYRITINTTTESKKHKDVTVRIEKTIYGDQWALKRTYKKGKYVVGDILKNPHTDLYVAVRLDFVNRKYITKEFHKFSDARKFVLKDLKNVGRE